jgi:hypothetical protein
LQNLLEYDSGIDWGLVGAGAVVVGVVAVVVVGVTFLPEITLPALGFAMFL